MLTANCTSCKKPVNYAMWLASGQQYELEIYPDIICNDCCNMLANTICYGTDKKMEQLAEGRL